MDSSLNYICVCANHFSSNLTRSNWRGDSPPNVYLDS